MTLSCENENSDHFFFTSLSNTWKYCRLHMMQGKNHPSLKGLQKRGQAGGREKAASLTSSSDGKRLDLNNPSPDRKHSKTS